MRFASHDGQFLVVKPPALLSDAIVDEILAGLVRQLAQRERYVLVFDLSVTGIPNATQRAKLANHVKKQADAIRRNVVALAIVAPSPLVRGIVTALFWVAAPPTPHEIFASQAEAIAWAETKLESRSA